MYVLCFIVIFVNKTCLFFYFYRLCKIKINNDTIEFDEQNKRDPKYKFSFDKIFDSKAT